MYKPITFFTAIILFLSIIVTSAAPVTATSSSIDVRNATINLSKSFLNSTTLRHPDGLFNNTYKFPLAQPPTTPNSLNSISFNVPKTSPQMTLLFFAFGPPIPREEFRYSNLQSFASVSGCVRRGNGNKPIAHGFWKHYVFFEDEASVEYAISDHSQLGEEKAMDYNELLSVIGGIGYFSLDTERCEGFTFDVSIAGRGSVGAGHVERHLLSDTGDGSDCESDESSRGVAVT